MSYRVQLPRTGETFEALAGETVLQAAQRAGVPLDHDCEAGGCGTCRIRLIQGCVFIRVDEVTESPKLAE